MIEWHPVTSSRITHEAYDPEREIIYVRFTGGGEHQYEACPQDVWEASRRRASRAVSLSVRYSTISRTASTSSDPSIG